MGIYRGDGGSGDSTNDAYASQVALDANTASTKAAEAAQSAADALQSANNAATSEGNADADRIAAEAAKLAAETAESNASTSASNALNSANNASTSESNALNSANAASTSESNALTSANNASNSAAAALVSEGNASTSETNAGNSATAASNSATAAGNAQTAAENARDAAQTAQNAAEAAQEAIDGLYLGAQASNPTVDLNGNPVTAGDWYFNTTVSGTRVYDGSVWNSIDPTLVGDTSPQLGGTLDANGFNIDMGVNVITDAKVAQWDSISAGGLTTSTTFGGDVSGTYDNIQVADDSHNHIISNIDGLQTALDGKQPTGSYLTANQTITLSGAVTGSGTTSITTTLATVDGGTY